MASYISASPLRTSCSSLLVTSAEDSALILASTRAASALCEPSLSSVSFSSQCEQYRWMASRQDLSTQAALSNSSAAVSSLWLLRFPAAPSSKFRSRLGTSCCTNPSIKNSLDATAGMTGNTAAAAEKATIRSSMVCFSARPVMNLENNSSPLSLVASSTFDVASIA